MEEQDKGLPVSFRISASIMEDVKKLAEKKMSSVTALVKAALTEYIERESVAAEMDIHLISTRLLTLEKDVEQLKNKLTVLTNVFKTVSQD